MSTAAIGATSAGSTASSSTDRGANSLTSQDFFKLLITELRQQDPLEPSKTSDMISQVSQIRNIELSGNLSNTLDALAKQQRISGATDLIGKNVTAMLDNGDGTQQAVQGLVTGVRFASDGTAIVDLDSGTSVPLTTVVGVNSQSATAPPATATSTDPKAASAKGLLSNPVQWLQNFFTLS